MKRAWVVKLSDGGYALDHRKDGSGERYIPKYPTKRECLRKSACFFKRPDAEDTYKIVRARVSKLRAYEHEMNARLRTAHGRAMQRAHAEIAKQADRYLSARGPRKSEKPKRKKMRHVSSAYED